MSGIHAAILNSGSNIIYAVGTVKRYYAGYAGDNAIFFDSRTPFLTEIQNSPLSQTWFGEIDRSVLWIGYIRPNISGSISFNFSVGVDDASNYNMFWIGPTARAGYTAANSLFQGGGGTVNTLLSAGIYYPIRLQVSYSGDDGFFDDPELFFTLFVNSSSSYPVFYNSLTQGF